MNTFSVFVYADGNDMSPPLQTQKVICIIRCHGKDISLEDEEDDNQNTILSVQMLLKILI
jgi:hypothetical protein